MLHNILHICSGSVTQVSEAWPVGFFYLVYNTREGCVKQAEDQAILVQFDVYKNCYTAAPL